jgi:hypothetical protein
MGRWDEGVQFAEEMTGTQTVRHSMSALARREGAKPNPVADLAAATFLGGASVSLLTFREEAARAAQPRCER